MLDGIDAAMKRGVTFYDAKTQVILHDRPAVLASLYRNGSVLVPQKVGG